jgi:pentatricopeptide repeat protein
MTEISMPFGSQRQWTSWSKHAKQLQQQRQQSRHRRRLSLTNSHTNETTAPTRPQQPTSHSRCTSALWNDKTNYQNSHQQQQQQQLLQDIASSRCNTDVYHRWLKRYQSHPSLCYAVLQRMKQLYHEGQQQQFSSRTTPIMGQPTSTTYAMVMTCFVKCGENPQISHDLLDELLEYYQQQEQIIQSSSSTSDPNVFTPTYKCFDLVIQAWAKCHDHHHDPPAGRAAGDMALQVLEQLQAYAQSIPEFLEPPDVITWTHVMQAIKTSQSVPPIQGALQCQAVLQRMEEAFQQGHSKAKPDARCYNMVLDAWAQAATAATPTISTNTNHNSHHMAAVRAEQLLRHMQHLYQHQGETMVKPTHVSYSSCIQAWANSMHAHAADRAMALWKEMMEDFYTTNKRGDSSMDEILSSSSLSLQPPPPQHALGALLTALTRSPRLRPDVAAQRAQAMYDQYVQRFGSSAATQPSSYDGKENDDDDRVATCPLGALMQAWAKAGNAQRAEELLQEWNQQYHDARRKTRHNTRCHPTTAVTSTETMYYSTVLDAWSRSGHAEAPDRAMALFYEMQARGIPHTLHTMVALITTWGRSRRPDRVQEAQALFQNLTKDPTSSTTHSSDDGNMEDSADRTRHWSYNSGGITIAYNAMLDTYANANEPELAEALLRQMKLSNANIISFSTVLLAWSHSASASGGPRAQAILEWMQSLYQQGQITFQADTIIYNHVIRAWSRSIPTSTTDQTSETDCNSAGVELAIVQHVLNVMEEMKQQAGSMPNFYTYLEYLQMLVQCQHLPAREQYAKSALQEMAHLGMPATNQIVKLAKSCGFVAPTASVNSFSARQTPRTRLDLQQATGGSLAQALRRIQSQRQPQNDEWTGSN